MANDDSMDDSVEQNAEVTVGTASGQALNGLGMMLLQYLEQNLADSRDKVELARRLRAVVAVEMEKGIACTVDFQGSRIELRNGIEGRTDLHLKGSYLAFADLVSGKANPLVQLARGKMKLGGWPGKPIQSVRVFRFLKIPQEFLTPPRPSHTKVAGVLGVVVALGLGLALGAAYLFHWLD
ncbi:MAG: SCP2 sterol-binding domain-containing protein [Deltaproteobacteria bacterium]|nr:SCP2 sterol-binding domain-containing protein [Deltaproteobacteria bacterium]